MLNWENKVHKKLKISEVLGILENTQNPTLRDVEILGLYWFTFQGYDFLKTRKSLYDLYQNSKNPFCSGHNIFTIYKNLINQETELTEDYFDEKLKQLEKLNRTSFLIETIHKTYYSVLEFNVIV